MANGEIKFFLTCQLYTYDILSTHDERSHDRKEQHRQNGLDPRGLVVDERLRDRARGYLDVDCQHIEENQRHDAEEQDLVRAELLPKQVRSERVCSGGFCTF